MKHLLLTTIAAVLVVGCGVTTSNDDGTSWSWPTKLGQYWAVGHLLGPVKNKPIQPQLISHD